MCISVLVFRVYRRQNFGLKIPTDYINNEERLLGLLFGASFSCLRNILLMHFQVNAAASSSVNAAGRNALMTSLTICCGYVICWSPNQILTMISVFGGTVDYSTWFYHFSVMMVFVNSCINPFIYAAKYREFQTGVKRLMHREVHPGGSQA